MTNPMQPLDPSSPPGPVTPADSPSSPAGYAMVTPRGQGPAPYDIQAQLPDLQGAFDAAGVAAGDETSVYPSGPRQAATAVMIDSPAGFGSAGYDIDAGFHEGGGAGWPYDMEPVHDGP